MQMLYVGHNSQVRLTLRLRDIVQMSCMEDMLNFCAWNQCFLNNIFAQFQLLQIMHFLE